MEKLIVVGGGGFAKEIIWLAKDCGFDVIGVLDDSTEMHGKCVSGVDVLGSINRWIEYDDCSFVVAIGSPRVRYKIVNIMKELGEPVFATLIHPDVKISDSVDIGIGSMICVGSILTVDITVGEHCVLNLNVTVGHETQIGDFVTVAPMSAVSGCVTLDDLVEVGTSSCIRQGLTLSKGAMLGMGGVLTKNIPANFIFAGNPAKKLKEIPVG